MTTHELIQRLTVLKAALRRDTEFVNLVETIAGRYGLSIQQLNTLLKQTDANDIKAHAGSLKNVIGETVDIIKNLSLPKVFVEIERTKERLEQVNSSLDVPEGDGLGNLIQELSNFRDEFEALVKGYEPNQTLQLISSARALSITLKVTVNLIDLMIEKLETHAEVKENEQALSVLFPSADEYKDVLTKLDALSGIYSELCPLFGVSASEHPLRIIKVETGSLWVYIIGHTLVIGFMVWLLKASAGFIYRNYTIEGKISAIPREIQAADSVLQFTKKLEEAGVDSTPIKEEIGKAIFATSSKLNRLVANQPSISINDETYSVGDAVEEKFLQESKRPLLEDGLQSVDTPSDADEAQTGSVS